MFEVKKMNILQRVEWKIYKTLKRRRLKNLTPTIISSNCNGEMIYYDMGLPFYSPFINLSFDMNDYMKLLKNLKYYMSLSIKPSEDNSYDYPTGMLGDIKIHFNHYDSFETAVQKWEQRKKRIDWENLFILAIDGDNCTYESMEEFNKLPFKNKVMFTGKEYPEFPSTYYIKGFEEQGYVGVLIYFRKQFRIRRYLDDFDYISFLNGECKR